MRVIGGYIKSTPIHVMETDLYLQPLEIRRHYLAGKYYLKINSSDSTYINSFINKLYQLKDNRYWRHKKSPLLVTAHEYLRNLAIHKSNTLEMFSLNTWVQNIDLRNIIHFTNLQNRGKRSYNNLELLNICNKTISKYVGFYRIFTDGSKDYDNKRIGAAFYDEMTDSHMKLNIKCNVSIMHAELIAIAEALSYVESINFDKFIIFTDSKCALQHLARCTSTFRGLPLAYTILKTILELTTRSKIVILKWIPSHVGVDGNETADKLAKQACSDGVDFNLLPPYNEHLYLVKNKCRELWKEYFNKRSLEKGIWFKTIQPQPYNSPWIDNSEFGRQDLVLLLRLRSGHIPLNKFAYLMRKTNSPLCSACNVQEDVYHILMECVRNEGFRRQLFKDSSIGLCNTYLSNPNTDHTKKILALVRCALAKRP